MAVSTPPAPGPLAPVPPRSRVRSHWGGTIGALILLPLGWLAWSSASGSVAPTLISGQRPTLAAIAVGCLAAVILALPLWWTHRSSVGAAVGSLLALGLASAVALSEAASSGVSGIVPARILGLPARTGTELLLALQVAVVLAVVLAVGALTASAARRQGRRREREDAEAVERSGTSAAPRNRLVAHLLSSAVGVIGAPIALAAATALTLTAVGDEGAPIIPLSPVGEVTLNDALITTAVCGLALAAIVGVALASTLGTAIAGGLWLASTAAYIVRPAAQGRLDALLAPLLRPLVRDAERSPLAVLDGTLTSLVIGTALIAVAIGVHHARRDGRRTERAELAHQRAHLAQRY